MSAEGSEPLEVTQRLRCCICGEETDSADDYVLLTLSTEETDARQGFGAHAEHLNDVFAPGFNVEIHLM